MKGTTALMIYVILDVALILIIGLGTFAIPDYNKATTSSSGPVWSFYKTRTITNYNVPVGIAVLPTGYVANVTVDTATYLAGGDMVLNNCADYFFINASNNEKLVWEIENNTCNTNETIYWVRHDKILQVSGNEFLDYYGNENATNQSNASGTWNNVTGSNYVGVFHMAENGNMRDSSGHGNLTPTAVTLHHGLFGNGYDFDGSTSFAASAADNNIYDLFQNQNFTVEFWMNHTTASANFDRIIGKRQAAGGSWWGISVTNGQSCQAAAAGSNVIIMEFTGGACWNTSIGGMNNSVWRYVTFVADNSVAGTWKGLIYIDGIIRQNFTLPAASFDNTASLEIAQWNNIQRYDGDLDEIRISHRALTGYEISANYNKTINTWSSAAVPDGSGFNSNS